MKRRSLTAMVAASLVLAACGGDDDGDGGGDSVSAEDYASAVCTSTQDWVGGLQKRATDLQGALGSNATPEEGKNALAGFLDDVLADTDDWVAALDEAGVPDVDGGEAAADELRSAAEDAKGVLEDTRARVDDLPTDDEQQFAREAGEVGSATQESLGKVGDAISEPESKDLRDALQDAPACSQLAGQ
jgi:hypothetical protein